MAHYTDEQIEKAAKAAFFARYPRETHPSAWDFISDKDRARWRSAARAALEEVMPGEPSFWMVQDAEGRTMYIGGPANKGYAHNTAKHIGGTVYALYARPAPEPGAAGALAAHWSVSR